jgi:hypothetical protein
MRSSILVAFRCGILLAILGLQLGAQAVSNADASENVAEATTPAHPAQEFLATGDLRVSVMGLVTPPRLNALQARLQAAMRADPEFWMRYVEENDRPGEILPYHAKMGITRDEYSEMLRLFKQVRMAPVSEASLKVRLEGSRRFVLDGGSALPQLSGIVIDLRRDEVISPLGKCIDRKQVTPNNDQSVTGPWRGVRWKCEEVDKATMSGTQINLGLGRLETGRVLLYYDAKRIKSGQMEANVTVVLNYDAPSR